MDALQNKLSTKQGTLAFLNSVKPRNEHGEAYKKQSIEKVNKEIDELQTQINALKHDSVRE